MTKDEHLFQYGEHIHWTELRGDVKMAHKLDGSQRYSLTTGLIGPRGIRIVSPHIQTGW
jgi:hypothetical protein